MHYLALCIIAVIAIIQYRRYIRCSYYQVTKNSPLQVYLDKGKLGEYMTYKYLRGAENNGAKFLFNIYIPKGEEETTEIDVLMIHAKGLFVFESKNYSGWIFGNEYHKNWYQTLPKGRGRSQKETFYNPVMQNRGHIKHLKALLGEDVPMHSVITFSERCTLKSVEVKSADVSVINRGDVYHTVASICSKIENPLLSDEQIIVMYEKLYPYTQVDAATKTQHIENVEKKLDPASVQEPPHMRTCPRCGGSLVLRTASRGANAGNKFYGCSNYPKCRYIVRLSATEATINDSNRH